MTNELKEKINVTQSKLNHNSENKSLHAVLLGKNGRMSELWLPITAEGKHTFSVVDEQISIVAEENSWIAQITGSGFFFDENGHMCNQIVLSVNSLVVANIDNNLYSLYLEEVFDSNRIFYPYSLEKNMDILIGRNAVCDICYPNQFVSGNHAVLKYSGEKLTIINNGSTNGVYVNSEFVQEADLSLGDVVYIMGLYIIVGAGYITMNNVHRCDIITQRVKPLRENMCLDYPEPSYSANKLYDRKPRKKYKLDKKTIEIDLPPSPLSKTKMPLFLRLGNTALMGGQALLSGNYFSALTSMFFPALTQGFTEKDRKEYETTRVDRYREYLKCKEEEILTEIQFEEMFYNDIFPDFNETLSFVKKQSRLWERRRIDDDFLTVRIGAGNLPMFAEKKYAAKKFEMEPDFLQQEMYELAEKPSVLNNVPITISLLEHWVFGVVGNPQSTLQMIVQMISYVAITHAYDEVKMIVVASEELKEKLSFVKYLNHFWDDEHTIRFFATDSTDVQIITKYLKDKCNEENDKKLGDLGAKQKKQPAYVVFALDKDLFEQSEFFNERLCSGEYNGFSFVAAFNNIPKECTKLLDFRNGTILVDLNDPNDKDISLSLDNFDLEYLKRCMSRLSRLNLLLEGEKAYSLPSTISFLEMYGVGKVEHLNPISRWESNNPVKSLSVPIGVGTDGKLFSLDLHEKYQGPHGLVAGMTGSGKSEFIITYILSMAVNFSPDEVAFVLIDYKGGGLADAFVDPKRGIHLPHVMATITNLDGASIQRSLVSIQSELSRRQELFKQAKSFTNEGTMDIYDYQRLYRNNQVSEPMPHLFIISDEFAELKKQQPEFMDALISAARIGRSLGVHLILATQKPGGVVNDQIWSNTKFRACLRVQDKSDSMEMLKRSEAAELKHTGRFYLQVGYNEFFAMGQSAWCGDGYYPQENVIVGKDSSVEFIDGVGQVILTAKEKRNKPKSKSKQIVAIVRYLSDLSKRKGIVPRSLWCEPLPTHLEYRKLSDDVSCNSKMGISSLLGLVDDPEHQQQFPLLLDVKSFHHMLLCGQSGSGKSTFFKTMLYSLVMKYEPEDINFYILDLSDGILSIFSNLPHCGAYLTKENETDFERLLVLIQEIIEERKKMFLEEEVFSYEDYVKIHRIPTILILIDGWTNINSFVRGQEYSLNISKNMRDATNYGIHFIFSVNHLNEVSAKVKQELDYRIALQAKDKFDYNDILNVRGVSIPAEFPGRGVCVVDGKPFEYHVAVPYSDMDGQSQTATLKIELETRTNQLKFSKTAKRLPLMNNELEYDDFCNSFALDRIPLGFSMQTMKEISMPLQQLYTLGLYFGNPIGVSTVILNILTAFSRENADVFIVRRKSGTIFDLGVEKDLRNLFGEHIKLFDMNTNELNTLVSLIIENIQKTKKAYRDEFCLLNGIPESDLGRTKKASKYIRENSRPLVVLFESFSDLIATEMDADLQSEYNALFSTLKGYNVYFVGCFYPEDDSQSVHPLFRSFNKEDFSLLFGGQFHKQWITSIPSEFRKMEKINPNYNRFLMKYHNDIHKMIMPCGELATISKDPDEEEII